MVYISGCMDITIMEAHPEIKWEYEYEYGRAISQNPTLTIAFLLKNLNNITWDWWKVSFNKGIKASDIFNHPEIPWNMNGVSINKTLTRKDVLNHPELSWNYFNICVNLFSRYRFDLEFINTYVHAEHMGLLSGYISKYVELVDVDNNPEFPWDYDELAINNHMDINFVLKHKDEKWDWVQLTTNRGIKYRDIIGNPTLPWDSNRIWFKHDITLHDLAQFSESEIKYGELRSDVLTVEFIETHIDKGLNWYVISQHDFKHDRQVYAAKLVKKLWRKMVFERRFNHWLKLKLVHSEFNSELPHPSIGFPGGKDYLKSVKRWNKGKEPI